MANHIFKPNTSIRVFKALTDSGSPVPAEMIGAGILRHRYMEDLRDVATADFVHGFCSPLDMTNNELAGDHDFHFGEDLAVGYRISRKKVDPTALRTALKARTIEHVETWNQTHPDNQISPNKISKQLRANLVDSCISALLPATNWKEKMVGVFYLSERGLLVVSGATEKEAERIAISLQQCSEDATRFDDVGALELTMLFKLLTEAEYDAVLDACTEDNSDYADILASAMRHIWFLSETLSGTLPSRDIEDGTLYVFSDSNSGAVFNVDISSDTVICADFKSGDVIGESVCCKNAEHAPVRYAMWKKDMALISAAFKFYDTRGGSPNVGMSATNLGTLSLKHNSAKVKETETGEELEASAMLYLGNMQDSLSMLATVLTIFLRARTSKERWSQTLAAERVWLEAYVPPCEVQSDKDDKGVVTSRNSD